MFKQVDLTTVDFKWVDLNPVDLNSVDVKVELKVSSFKVL